MYCALKQMQTCFILKRKRKFGGILMHVRNLRAIEFEIFREINYCSIKRKLRTIEFEIFRENAAS